MDDDPLARTPAPQVLEYGSPQAGEVLAERYRLEEHIGDDMLGRQLWRGSDVILQRPVTVVLRYPGGDSAAEMLSAAVTASRIVHPHLIGVYDAIDEGGRAYVVREWVEGTSLRKVVAAYGPLEADKAVAIAHAVAAAVAALHETGMAHGNVQPGTVLIGDDGRVVLGDARADEAATAESDIRAVGAVLYCALTGRWPHAEAGAATEPDGNRSATGALAAPHEARAGIPDQVDRLAVDLLNPNLDLPSAEVLAGELGRLDNAEDHRSLFADEPLDLDAFDVASQAPETSTPTGRKMAIVIAALLVIAIAGTIVAVNTLGGDGSDNPQAGTSGTAAPGRAPSAGAVVPTKLVPAGVRIVDPGGDREEIRDAGRMIDGDLKTKWRSHHYDGSPNFGNIQGKNGLGVLIDLGRDTAVSAVQLNLAQPGASVELRAGQQDFGADKNGDTQIVNGFQRVGEPITDTTPTVVLSGDPAVKVRYLLVWFTKLSASPDDGANKYRVEVLELSVLGQQAG